MPLIVVANQGAQPAPQSVKPLDVVQRARRSSGNAALAIAYTDPIIRIDQRALQYRQRQALAWPEFSFDTGTLTLTLRQEVLVSNLLSPCAQQKWAAHEQGHVADNQQIMTQMDAAIRADPVLSKIFIQQHWFPKPSFAATEKTIENTIGTIFARLTAKAVAARDTRAEYMRVHRDVLLHCPEPYIYEVNRGDSLSRLADFFYGHEAAWRSIYNANRKVIGGNPNLILPGQQLAIPRQP
jgi:hypothetical protein